MRPPPAHVADQILGLAVGAFLAEAPECHQFMLEARRGAPRLGQRRGHRHDELERRLLIGRAG